MSFFRPNNEPEIKPTVDVLAEDEELDHRLHFQVATEHFTHDNERIKLHFKVNKTS